MDNNQKESKIMYIKEFMPLSIAEEIYSYGKRNKDGFTQFGNYEQEFKVNVFSENNKETQRIRAIATEWGKKVYDFVLENYPGPFLPFNTEFTHIAKFEKGWGMHEHFDSSKPNDIATLIYLNNDYSGGEIYFPDYDIGYKPNPGDLLCFPDNPDYVHGVKPITDGTRYTTPRWFTRIV